MRTRTCGTASAVKSPIRIRKARRTRTTLRVAYLSRETSVYNQHAVMEFALCANEFGNWNTLIATLGEVGILPDMDRANAPVAASSTIVICKRR